MLRRCWPLLFVAALAGCTQAQAPEADGRPTTAAPAPAASPTERLRADWVNDVESGCRFGLKMYPNLALGTNANIDTVEVGVRQFHESLSRIPPADDPAAREEARVLVAQTRQLSTEWNALATATSVVPWAQRQAAVENARRVILAVAAIGAPSCRDLAPSA